MAARSAHSQPEASRFSGAAYSKRAGLHLVCGPAHYFCGCAPAPRRAARRAPAARAQGHKG